MADNLGGVLVDSSHRCDGVTNGVDVSVGDFLVGSEQDADRCVASVRCAAAVSSGSVAPASTFQADAVADQFVVGDVPPAFVALVVVLDAFGGFDWIADHADADPMNGDALGASQGSSLARRFSGPFGPRDQLHADS